MKQNFESALAFVLEREGGYCDHPSDRGGATNQGITQSAYDSWRLGCGLARQPVVGLTGVELRAIYRGRYWDAVRGDDLPGRVDLVVFDAAVNAGPKQAIKWLQRALGVNDDGALGPVTLGALYQAEVGPVVNAMLDQRLEFYERIVERDESQRVFLKGWMNRVRELQKAAA